MAKLYEIKNEFNELLLMADEQGLSLDDIKDTIDGIEFEFEEKADSTAKMIRSLIADADAVKAEKDRLADREKALRNSADNLKKYLETMMLEVDKKKFRTKLFSFNIQKNAPIVKVEVDELLPKKYLIPQPDKVDKKQLLKDLKAGVIEANENMRLVQTESLRIR
jgi:hypothetical protein